MLRFTRSIADGRVLGSVSTTLDRFLNSDPNTFLLTARVAVEVRASAALAVGADAPRAISAAKSRAAMRAGFLFREKVAREFMKSGPLIYRRARWNASGGSEHPTPNIEHDTKTNDDACFPCLQSVR